MTRQNNVEKARSTFDSWPSWKQNVSITKHSRTVTKESHTGTRVQGGSSSRLSGCSEATSK